MQTLGIISVNLWQILISLANLFIIFLILKKFLWKPVKKMMEQRQAMVDKQFADAAAAQAQADANQAQWAEKLAGADDEVNSRIAAADETARRHGDRIVAEAKDKAAGILRQAESEAQLERQKATASIKGEIASVSAELAEKLLEREVNPADHTRLIESFLDEVGDAT
jgi:F-type H+-transporting ATPase subunit b